MALINIIVVFVSITNVFANNIPFPLDEVSDNIDYWTDPETGEVQIRRDPGTGEILFIPNYQNSQGPNRDDSTPTRSNFGISNNHNNIRGG